MINTLDELIDAVARGASTEILTHNVELKESWKQEYGKKISSISNQVNAHGWMVIGVSDNGVLKSNSESWGAATEHQVSNHITEYLDPIQTVEYVQCHSHNGSWFIVIRMRNPGSVVYWNRNAFMPIGTHKEIMENEDILSLTIKLPGLNDFSKQDWKGVVDEGLLMGFAKRIIEQRGHKITSIYGDTPELIIAGLGIRNKCVGKVLFGETNFRVVVFDKSDSPIFNESYMGLYRLLNGEVTTAVSQSLTIDNVEWGYTEREIRECFGNAVAHTAYFENGGEILVEIHPNRICVSNLCLPESSVFANKWLTRAHKSYNLLLAELLRLSKYIDELGLGKGLIYCESIKRGARPPVIDVEPAGSRYRRWKITIFSSSGDSKITDIIEMMNSQYPGSEQKALIAVSLLYWEGKSYDDLKPLFDHNGIAILDDILRDPRSPIYLDMNKIVRKTRWVICLQLGQSSMVLSESEKIKFWNYVSSFALENSQGIFTTNNIRRALSAHESRAETTMISNLTSEWVRSGKIERIKRGQFMVIDLLPYEEKMEK